MLQRVLEPEVMDTAVEAADYDAMDHSAVNRLFVDDLLNAVHSAGLIPTAAANADAINGTSAGPVAVPDARCKAATIGRATSILDAGTGTAEIPIELCRRSGTWTVTAVDLAAEMLKVAADNVSAGGLDGRILLERADSKCLAYSDGYFDAVMSNSIVHHVPEPIEVLAELKRVLRRGGLLFVRDLLRPPDEETLEQLVVTYAGDENLHQRQMFRDSLHASLTVSEMRVILAKLQIPPQHLAQTSDRHWTLVTTNA